MIAIRKAWWATALLAVFAGCNNEEPTGENPPPPPPAVVKTPGDTGAPVDKKDEAPKDDTKKSEGDMPKDESKGAAAKDEGPALTPPANTPAKGEDKGEAPKDETKKEASAKPALSAVEVAEIEKLPADERTVALKQVVCPVSGKHLGSMKTPFKTTAEGKTFFLCCEGCDEEVKENPKQVLAKLGPK